MVSPPACHSMYNLNSCVRSSDVRTQKSCGRHTPSNTTSAIRHNCIRHSKQKHVRIYSWRVKSTVRLDMKKLGLKACWPESMQHDESKDWIPLYFDEIKHTLVF